MTKRLRSEGAIQLGKIGRTDEELAARLDCKRAQVTQWRLAIRTPGTANRTRMRDKLKIPVPSWDVFPRGAPRADVIASTPLDYEPASPSADDGSVQAKAKRLERLVRSMLDAIEVDKSLTTMERFRLSTDVHNLLDKLGKLTGESQQMPETRILRLPAWRIIQERTIAALRPFPKALAAFVSAVEGLGGEL